MTKGFAFETVATKDLYPHPRNYRVHPDDQIKHLVESIREHGLYRNVVIAKDGTILAGHGVVEAARRMGLLSIPVVRLDLSPGDPRAIKVMVGDNEIEHLAEQDDRLLTELLKEIDEFDIDGLLGTGYDIAMLAGLAFVTRPSSEIADFDEAAHWAGMPEYDEGKPPAKLVVSFRDETSRDSFLQAIGANHINGKNGKTWSIWWPERLNEDTSSVRFEG